MKILFSALVAKAKMFSSDDGDDLEMVERVMNCVYTSSKSTVKILVAASGKRIVTIVQQRHGT